MCLPLLLHYDGFPRFQLQMLASKHNAEFCNVEVDWSATSGGYYVLCALLFTSGVSPNFECRRGKAYVCLLAKNLSMAIVLHFR